MTSPQVAAIIAEARARIADDGEPDWQALKERIRLAGGDEAEQRRALQQIDRLISVHRARTLVTREPPTARPAVARPRRSIAFRTRPTITGNMDVRRQGSADAATLLWDRAAGVAGWEVRTSRRESARADYVVQDTLELAATVTTVELALDELPLRVHVLGRAAGGRLLRHAIVSGLTSANWTERWQRRATAS